MGAAGEGAPLIREDGRLFWLFDHLALNVVLAGRAKDGALIAGYADAVHQKIGCMREPMGRRAVEGLGLLLREALPDAAAELCRDSPLGMALANTRNI